MAALYHTCINIPSLLFEDLLFKKIYVEHKPPSCYMYLLYIPTLLRTLIYSNPT